MTKQLTICKNIREHRLFFNVLVMKSIFGNLLVSHHTKQEILNIHTNYISNNTIIKRIEKGGTIRF